MQNNVSFKFIYKDGVLKPKSIEDAAKFSNFSKVLTEGTVIECFLNIDSEDENGTLSQLAKVHWSISQISRHLGYTFEEMKEIVKEKAGLVDPASKELKSFSKCSKSELSDAIQVCINLGAESGFYF